LDRINGDNSALLERNRSLFNAFAASRRDIECMPARHGVTAFPKWAGGDTHRLDALLRERYDTAVVPGRWFEMPDHFRIGFGLPARDFEEALNRLGAALDELG
jgi:aspartate/methionine/tyrosine aminotransferase